ncbi:MAG TPA: acyltransferase family protein [Nocardioides sp.]|uniref:acyltransferase family protein n=1 Tax=Nocardioides sp. TaxID=35761 RepID=UPI002E338E94|nr:acyltransferase family protein [Nocardioides sp.]HEX5087962.1 acyltransferase family protein [Nocardioides sp.]
MQKERHFRPDIQGLRALAVLLVIVAHAGFGAFAGGFVGVDVFFVISGFLISQLLFREVERSGRVSIPGFYARRARRILPAATLVTIATIVASGIWLSAIDLLEVCKDAVWAVFFAANVRFAAVGTDYFAQDQPPSPLQHYWSLSVEEQFYLVWPALLLGLVLLARRRALPPRLVLAVLALVTGASFAWSVVSTSSDPLAAYFSTPARVWELGLGALTALVAGGLAPRWSGLVRGLVCTAGLVCIAIACVTFSEATPFPGYAAALPVVGSALVLLAGAGGQAVQPLPVRALGVLPMRTVGDWSYSLYLWHWPVLIIAARVVDPDLGHGLGFWRTAVCLVVVFVLSGMTYRYVEQPFRSPQRFPLRRALMLYPTAVVLVLAASLGGRYYSEWSSGALGDNPAISLTNFGVKDPSRYDLDKDKTVALVQASVIAARHHMAIPSKLDPDILMVRDDEPDVGACDYENGSRELCPRGDPDADRSIVVFGNSHGRMWIPAFDQMGKELGYKTYYFVKPNCGASLVSVGELVPGSPLWPECDDFRSWALDQIAELHPDLVVVSSSGPNPVLYDQDGNRIPKEGVPAAVHDGYVDLFDRLSASSQRAVLLRDVPKSEDLPDECLTKKGNDLGDCLFTPLPASVEDADISEAAARSTGTEVVDPTRWLCWDGSCPTVIGNVLPYRDRGHLTTVYAAALADELSKALGLSG